jgi:hypothetical protein
MTVSQKNKYFSKISLVFASFLCKKLYHRLHVLKLDIWYFQYQLWYWKLLVSVTSSKLWHSEPHYPVGCSLGPLKHGPRLERSFSDIYIAWSKLIANSLNKLATNRGHFFIISFSDYQASCFSARPIRLTVIMAVMYVSTFKTDVILYIYMCI